MKFSPEYHWTAAFNELDSLFLEDVLGWDETIELVFLDYNIFSFITSAFFANTHYFLDFFVKTSFLDLLLFNQVSTLKSIDLFIFFVIDITTFFDNNFSWSQAIFYSDYQDFFIFVLYHTPELLLAFNDFYINYFLNFTIDVQPSTSFDVYNENLGLSISEFLEYFLFFFVFVWVAIIFIFSTRLNQWRLSNDSYLVKVYNYFFWLSKEVRLQFDASFQAFFFAFLYVTMMIITFDDDQEEILEFFNSICFYFFIFTFVIYLFKYSIHFFSFLEPSKIGGRSITWIINQFKDDLFNTIALTMRFLVLMARLNIYDGVDDILDSYYIFVADFDEDEYFTDLFFSTFSVLFFDTDVNDDRSFFFEDEMDFTGDLFTIYFIIWGKIWFFLLFMLEVLVRTILALYVTYLLIFEINTVNRSYSEDTYLFSKRSVKNQY